jgi:hypothetical protein
MKYEHGRESFVIDFIFLIYPTIRIGIYIDIYIFMCVISKYWLNRKGACNRKI